MRGNLKSCQNKPPYSNRGVNKKGCDKLSVLNLEVGFTVDWISASFNNYEGMKFAKKIGFNGWASDVEGVCPRGYNMCRELETGALIAWHTENKQQGTLVVLSGSALRWYYGKNVDWLQMLTWIKECGGRTSRVDLAVDIKNGGIQQKDLCKPNRKPYKGKGRTPKWLPVGEPEEGWTWYVGSRSSDKFLRVYDKAKERGDYDTDYIRVELECKGEVAHAIGHAFPLQGTSECKAMACTLIKGTADISHPAWAIAMECEPMVLTMPQGKRKDTLGWLVNVCAPALAKQIVLKPHEAVLDEFWDALRKELLERGVDA